MRANAIISSYNAPNCGTLLGVSQAYVARMGVLANVILWRAAK